MKKNVLGILSIAIISFAACAGKKQIAKQQSTSVATTNVTYVQMSRTACFGRCPEYSIEVYNDGLVRYTGRRNVKDSGIYEKNIGEAKAAALLQDFNTYRVDTCKESYQILISDLPGLNYTIQYNGKTKNIRNASFGPNFLKILAKNIDDAIAVDATWKKIPSAKQD